MTQHGNPTGIMDNEEKTQKRTMSYVDEAYRLIQTKPEILDVVILNNVKNPIKTTMQMEQCLAFAGPMEGLLEKMEAAMREMFPAEEVLQYRIRSTHNETFIVPDGKITVIVIQAAKDRNPVDVLIR